MITVRVLLFGHYRDYASADNNGALTVEVPEGATAGTVAALLAARDHRFADVLIRARVAVAAAFATPETPLHEGDEIAFLPPMSGG